MNSSRSRLAAERRGAAGHVITSAPLSGVYATTLERQQQRILHRTMLIDYVLAAEQRNGAGLTLGDALAELLRDIGEAARQVGTILQQTTKRAELH